MDNTADCRVSGLLLTELLTAQTPLLSGLLPFADLDLCVTVPWSEGWRLGSD